jgi:enoyl-[acyl-carrier-protein] reductase (NADH)
MSTSAPLGVINAGSKLLVPDLRRLVTIDEVGAACVFLCSPFAAAMTGETLYIDGGYHILA